MIEGNGYIRFSNLLNEDVFNVFTNKSFDFNYHTKSKEELDKQYNELEDLINYNFKYIKKGKQSHSTNVKVVTEDNLYDELENVDGLITNLKGIALVTFVADCEAILLYDKKNKVIGNIHSGWKGTLNRIIKNAINMMIDSFNTDPKDLIVSISPSIQKCCFEVDEDVYLNFKKKYNNIDSFTLKKEKKYYIDLIGLNKNSLKELGVKEDNIYCSNICTKCNSNKYHSYRANKECGRNLALICLK